MPNHLRTAFIAAILAAALFSSSAGYPGVSAQGEIANNQAGLEADSLNPAEALKRGYDLPVPAEFKASGIEEGRTGTDFTLVDTKGDGVSLSNLLESKPVVMILGSYT